MFGKQIDNCIPRRYVWKANWQLHTQKECVESKLAIACLEGMCGKQIDNCIPRRNVWKANWQLHTQEECVESKLAIVCTMITNGSKLKSDEHFHLLTTDRTDSHSDYSAHLCVVQYCLNYRGLASIYLTICIGYGCFRINCEGGLPIFFKVSSPFCIPVARQC